MVQGTIVYHNVLFYRYFTMDRREAKYTSGLNMKSKGNNIHLYYLSRKLQKTKKI